jgi:hypothetical protein
VADPLPRELKTASLFKTRNAAIVLSLLLAIYGVSFVALYPEAITVSDEGSYLRQAQLIVRGSRTVDRVDPFTGESSTFTPGDQYPLGTAMMLVPFVAAGGWQAGFWLPMLCLTLAAVVTARWLSDAGHSPLWAALILIYPPALVMGRVAMSDAPSLLAVATGLWLFWRGTLRGGGWAFFAAGFIAGFSMSIREGNVLLFTPLCLGARVRRDAGVARLILGGLLGVGVRVLSSWLYYDDPFFTKRPDPFAPESLLQNALLYLMALLVFVPGGLAAGLAYRGRRRIEVVATVVLFTGFHFLYGYSAEQSGWAKRLILGPRYFIPMLPLLALCSAEVWPRWARRLTARATAARMRHLDQRAVVVVAIVLVTAASAAVGLQWVHSGWADDQARIRDAIYRETEEGSAIVTNWVFTGKFFDLIYGDRRVLRRKGLTQQHIARVVERNENVYYVFLDRTDSDFGRNDATESAALRHQTRNPVRLQFDLQVTPTDRLHIWRIREPLPDAGR